MHCHMHFAPFPLSTGRYVKVREPRTWPAVYTGSGSRDVFSIQMPRQCKRVGCRCCRGPARPGPAGCSHAGRTSVSITARTLLGGGWGFRGFPWDELASPRRCCVNDTSFPCGAGEGGKVARNPLARRGYEALVRTPFPRERKFGAAGSGVYFAPPKRSGNFLQFRSCFSFSSSPLFVVLRGSTAMLQEP